MWIGRVACQTADLLRSARPLKGWAKNKSLALFADLIADQRTRGCTTDGSQRAAKYGIAGHAAEHCAGSGADLRVGRAGAAAGQGNKGGSAN